MSNNAQRNPPFDPNLSPQDVSLWRADLVRYLKDTGPPIRGLNNLEKAQLSVQYYLLNLAKKSDLVTTPEHRVAFLEYLSHANHHVLSESIVVSSALGRLQSENELLRHQVTNLQQQTINLNIILRHLTATQFQRPPINQPQIQPRSQ